MTDLQRRAAAQNAWAIETHHRNLKQFAAVERGQFRLEVSQRNPSASQFVLSCALNTTVFTNPSPCTTPNNPSFDRLFASICLIRLSLCPQLRNV